VKLILDEMYPPALAEGLKAVEPVARDPLFRGRNERPVADGVFDPVPFSEIDIVGVD
jgi:hypothetical protein